MNTKFLIKALAVGCVVAGVASVSTVALAADSKAKAEPQFKSSPKVNDAIQAASKAIDAKKFDVAAEKVKAAESVSKRTEYDDFQINEIKAYMYVKQDNMAEVLPLYEKSIESPQFFKDDSFNQRLKGLVQVSYKLKQVDKAIVYAKRLTEALPTDRQMLLLLGQLQYEQKQHADTKVTYQKLIDLAVANNEKPDEIWLQVIQFSANELNDQDGVAVATEVLTQYYPTKEHWTQLINFYEQNDRGSDGALLSYYRLRASVGILAKPDYVEYAQIALDSALPAEALKVLKEGYDKKILGVDAKDKSLHDEMLAKATKGADSDRTQLPNFEKDAAKPNATGRTDMNLGLVHFTLGNYDKAAESLESSLKKGNIKDPDNVRLTLGISYYMLGDKERARGEFKKLASSKSGLMRVARLWDVRARIAT
jgi:tetratricopeptide (TPR) repeat protein